MSTIGLDFGTTNSLISFIGKHDAKCQCLVNEEDDRPHPSAVFYIGDETVVGREAKKRIENDQSGEGAGYVASPKKYLGRTSFYPAGREKNPIDMVTDLMIYLRDNALNHHIVQTIPNPPAFDKAVVSIPVDMKGSVRRDLREALKNTGIEVAHFVHEPLAALYGHFRQNKDYKERIAEYEGKSIVVFDWGGGTLDLTVCKVVDGRFTQIKNKGDDSVGGDVIDERIADHVVECFLKEEKMDHPGVAPGMSAQLRLECEKAKITLSTSDSATVTVRKYFANAERKDLLYRISVADLEMLSGDIITTGTSHINTLLDELGLDKRSIHLCLATGGIVNMPSVESVLHQLFTPSRVTISPKSDRIISEGCAWIAHDELEVQLAKPIEVEMARRTFVSVIDAGRTLRGDGATVDGEIDAYCVDPSDGLAKFVICRPRTLGKENREDDRSHYATLPIAIRKGARLWEERFKVKMAIDKDFVLTVDISSQLTGEKKSKEIHDLEFSLATVNNKTSSTGSSENSPTSSSRDSERYREGIYLRSNITKEIKGGNAGYQGAVPGEILYQYDTAAFDPERVHRAATKEQKFERNLYLRCICGNLPFQSCKCSGTLESFSQ